MSGVIRRRYLLLVIFMFMVIPFMNVAYGASSDNYSIDTDVLSGGGGVCNSTGYSLISTTGQPTAIGVSTSTNYKNYAGF